MPYVPFFDKSFPTKSGRIEFYVEALIPYDQQLPGYKEPVEAIPTNPLYQEVSAHVSLDAHAVPDPLAVRRTCRG